jgi:chemotaxis protein MotB
MSDADDKESTGRAGVPPWVMTFADLMTLLMCFFVLLLAFSEMDVLRFKQLSGSMKSAFGVQTDVEAKSIPKGTSIVAQEFSPGKPDPTAIKTVRQFTIDSHKSTLDLLDRKSQLVKETEDHAKRIRQALREEIKNGSVAVETEDMKVIIRILEKASFESGRAEVRPTFTPVLLKIGAMIDSNNGTVTVSGHTDNVPIYNERFRSNWDLSTSRAVSVTHELLKTATVDEARFMVTGHADTRPRAANDSTENRARNRRVDISIVRGEELDEFRDMSVAEPVAGLTPPEGAENE